MSDTMTAIGQRYIDRTSTGQHYWYVVSCKPRQELPAQESLRRQGFEVYLPRIKVRQRCRDRSVESVQVLFPRYLFAHVDRGAQSTASIRSTRGAIGLVRFDGEPAVAPNRVLDAMAVEFGKRFKTIGYDLSESKVTIPTGAAQAAEVVSWRL